MSNHDSADYSWSSTLEKPNPSPHLRLSGLCDYLVRTSRRSRGVASSISYGGGGGHTRVWTCLANPTQMMIGSLPACAHEVYRYADPPQCGE
ncbi:hypothetical protein CLCR_03212 [Cladophialophora carrionii]|uniref:Uncharacterized protein n=1 Tax=Cladophialophora carrionii TaxID=86049 RepID=A0A1C1D182_9EURO|nr:hypothetical protein CLCR_03212 [Cladophialophora carrionii]